MLRSQFSAMFPNFRRKIVIFLNNQWYDNFFRDYSAVFLVKKCQMFRRKHFENQNIGSGLLPCVASSVLISTSGSGTGSVREPADV
jgi:hypothetical protein